uniref:Uncharacterized protein n=1 Tax=Arundo donax TaxID=35708 RepID=A0A0A8ZDX4_ARUDO
MNRYHISFLDEGNRYHMYLDEI